MKFDIAIIGGGPGGYTAAAVPWSSLRKRTWGAPA